MCVGPLNIVTPYSSALWWASAHFVPAAHVLQQCSNLRDSQGHPSLLQGFIDSENVDRQWSLVVLQGVSVVHESSHFPSAQLALASQKHVLVLHFVLMTVRPSLVLYVCTEVSCVLV